MNRLVYPGALRGAFTPPPDKSISHRALILSAVAQGTSLVRNLLSADDIEATKQCLRLLGVEIVEREEGVLVIRGNAGSLEAPSASLNCQNSGTTMRLLTGLLATQPFSVCLLGDESLTRRPMERVLVPLRRMGATVSSSADGTPPVHIKGGTLQAIEYNMPVASAQLKSAILLAGLGAQGTTVVREPYPSRDHTERMLLSMGVELTLRKGLVSLEGPAWPLGCELSIPGDFSSAAPFIVGAAFTEGSELLAEGVGLNPGRIGLLNVLRRMGARIETWIDEGYSHEPLGSIRVRGGQLQAVTVGATEVPSMIDEVPLLIVAACYAEGLSTLRGLGELRVKESDRIESIISPLRAMGAEIELVGDDVFVRGGRLKAAKVSSSSDHRIAMALAIAGLGAAGPVNIAGSEWVSVSYPMFWQELTRLKGG